MDTLALESPEQGEPSSRALPCRGSHEPPLRIGAGQLWPFNPLARDKGARACHASSLCSGFCSYTHCCFLPLAAPSLLCWLRVQVAVAGRTGAGKSSIFSVLFRLRPILGGAVLVDGQETSGVNLHALRSRLSLMPQAPLLFKGTVRCARAQEAHRRHTVGSCQPQGCVSCGGSGCSEGRPLSPPLCLCFCSLCSRFPPALWRWREIQLLLSKGSRSSLQPKGAPWDNRTRSLFPLLPRPPAAAGRIWTPLAQRRTRSSGGRWRRATWGRQ